jgi:hypothetical protein
MYKIRQFSYREQEQRFRAACDWLKTLGVRVTATRVDEYSKRLADISDYYEEGKIDELVEKYSFPLLLNAMLESAEIVDIHAGLKSVNNPQLVAKLKDFVGGTAILSDETVTGNHPRNIGFELSMAAAAARCNLPVVLNPPSDISIPIRRQVFAVECKRPFTKKKIANRIREGLRQLEANIMPPISQIKVVAFWLSRFRKLRTMDRFS